MLRMPVTPKQLECVAPEIPFGSVDRDAADAHVRVKSRGESSSGSDTREAYGRARDHALPG
jgi:hypothetical protein